MGFNHTGFANMTISQQLGNRVRQTVPRILLACMAVGVSLSLPAPSAAQGLNFDELFGGESSNLGGNPQSAPEPKVTTRLVPSDAEAGEVVTLEFAVELAKGAYTYSQSKSFGGATKIEISESEGLDPIDDSFKPDHPPTTAYEELFGQNVEKFPGGVTWRRQYRLTPELPLGGPYVEGTLTYQVCDESSCRPLTHEFHATLEEADVEEVPFASTKESEEEESAVDLRQGYQLVPTRRGEPDPLTLQFELLPGQTDDSLITLAVTMDLDKGWHGYALKPHEQQIGLPTVIEIDDLANLDAVSQGFAPVREPELLQVDEDITELVYHGRVTWTKTFRVENEDSPFGVSGSIRYQICKDVCLPPSEVEFVLGSLQRAEAVLGARQVTRSAAGDLPASGEPKPQAFDPNRIRSEGAITSFWVAISLAFFAGMILNVMPCVLPVLAIKLLSFVQQAGESRRQILTLNLVYSAGVVTVFLILAVLSRSIGVGFGGLFQNTPFLIGMTCLVFAMGLSLLGVYEIPVPGLVGSMAGNVEQEGLTGAFFTGVFATLLATPCAGPMVGPVIFWSSQQPAAMTYLVWATMGIGMASPYLVAAFYPGIIHKLPQPGMWMVRFKELSGFVLIGTAIFLLYSLRDDLVVPVLVALLGIGMGLWMIGALYTHASAPHKKHLVRLLAASTTTLLAMFAYRLTPIAVQDATKPQTTAETVVSGATVEGVDVGELPWQPFTEERLVALLNDGTKAVLIDFTADWCLICKQNEKLALNTEATNQFVRSHDVITLYADYTNYDPTIKAWLDRFKHDGVPLTAIFPEGKPYDPILLRGTYTQGTLLEKLQEAVSGVEATSRLADDARAAGPGGALR